jgi:methyl acetate hydrolase
MTKWYSQNPKRSMFDKEASISDLIQPLCYEPGTSYLYSISLNWAGFFVERLSGMSLEDYFQQNIFQPLGIRSMTFLPKDETLAHLMRPCVRQGSSWVGMPDAPMGMSRNIEDVKLFSG